jgi:hypothetical protein
VEWKKILFQAEVMHGNFFCKNWLLAEGSLFSGAVSSSDHRAASERMINE